MKYFLHDTSAFEDEKISELFMEFGYEGLGLFYTILEKIAKQEKPIKTSVLKSQLKVGKKLNKCWMFIEVIGLISSNNGETFNKQLLNHSEKYLIKKETNSKRIREWRDRQHFTENVTCYEQKCNNDVTPSNISKDKISKEKKEEEEYKASFERARKLYSGTKNGLDTEFKNFQKKHKDWKSIVPTLEEKINNQINDRMEKQKIKAFVPEWKNFQTWINKRCWEQETSVVLPIEKTIPNDKMVTDEVYKNMFSV